MKISPLTEASHFVNQVREKTDGRGSQQHRHGYDQEQKRKQEHEATPEEVNAAVEAFGSDALAQANGLSATAQGNGPGLKVVLKDGTGAIVRQFTGEEFLKLREAAGTDSRARGKILDQKL